MSNVTAHQDTCCSSHACEAKAPPSKSCGCEDVAHGVETGSTAFRHTVWIVLGLNAAMFMIETIAALLAGSLSLQADALDFAGDTATYSISLAVIGYSATIRARAALFKGAVLGTFALFVLGGAIWRTFGTGIPEAATMGVIAFLALTVNVTAALLLMRFRDGDANVRSVWLCSRNDAIGNVAVLLAAVVVALTGTKWADLGVAAIMATLFLNTSVQIVQQARRELTA